MSVEAGNDAAPATRGLWAWTFYDWANQSFATVIQTFVFAAYFTNRLSANAEQGTVRWSMTIGITGFIVAVCVIFEATPISCASLSPAPSTPTDLLRSLH